MCRKAERSALAWVLSGDLAMQLVDGVGLYGDDPVDENRDKNDNHHVLIVTTGGLRTRLAVMILNWR